MKARDVVDAVKRMSEGGEIDTAIFQHLCDKYLLFS